MAKQEGCGGGCLIFGIAALCIGSWLKLDFWSAIVTTAVLFVAVPVILKVWFSGGSQRGRVVKNVKHSKTFWGDPVKNVTYPDTGKEVEIITRKTITGKQTEARIIREGSRGYYQTCHKCGLEVASDSGRFACVCGNKWGRR